MRIVDFIRINVLGLRWGMDPQNNNNTANATTIYRPSAILTNSYVAGPTIDTWNYNQLVIYWGSTLGSLTSNDLKVEFSADGTTWYQETFESVAAGVATSSAANHTTTAATPNLRLAIPITDRYVRISVHGTGTVTSSLAQLDVMLGINP
jgi:hypothetical protein